MVVLLLAGCAGSEEMSAPTPVQREIIDLGDSMERIHPDLFHDMPRTRFRAELEGLADRAPALSRDELVVGLMRIAALPGARDGHTGIFPYDLHAKTLHAYPIRLYDFADGLHVVGSTTATDLTGKRLVAIGDTPVERVVELVRPLAPHDNESGRRGLVPEFVATAEVLRGLGIAGDGSATFVFSDGSKAELEPVPADQVAGAFGGATAPLPTPHDPVWLRRLDDTQWLTTLERGRVVYLGYRRTTDSTFELAQRLERMAQKPSVRRVIVDVRLNHGGDNTTYNPLLDVLAKPAIGRKTVVLLGRMTFSAAGNFVADVDRHTKARFVGEPSGGAPSQWGDSTTVLLPRTGLTVRVATAYWEFGPPGDQRAATVPSVRVEPTAADFFAGRDPVLARALAVR